MNEDKDLLRWADDGGPHVEPERPEVKFIERIDAVLFVADTDEIMKTFPENPYELLREIRDYLKRN